MRKLTVVLLFAFVGLQSLAAQDRPDMRPEIKQQVRELVDEARASRAATSTLGKTESVMAPITGVGEPDSFGKNAKFMGTATAGFILIDATCSPADIGTLGPDDRCIMAGDPLLVTPGITFNDIGRITIPARALDNVLYAIANHNVFVNFQSASPGQARFSYSPQVTIESEALLDPNLIDPSKTPPAPYNGSFTTGGMGSLALSKFLDNPSPEFQTASYSRANTNGFSRTFFTALGLPNNVIDQIYKKPITVKLNVRVSGRFVRDGVITYSIRFLGN